MLMETVILQDGWTVEIRRRTKGKAMDQLYCVWVTPQKRQLYVMILGCLNLAFNFAPLYLGTSTGLCCLLKNNLHSKIQSPICLNVVHPPLFD